MYIYLVAFKVGCFNIIVVASYIPTHRHINLKIIVTKKDNSVCFCLRAKFALVLFRISLVPSSNIIQRRLFWFNLRTNYKFYLHPFQIWLNLTVFGLT